MINTKLETLDQGMAEAANDERVWEVVPEILTATGKHFNFLNPSPDEVCVEDIARALSNLCRFTGHCVDANDIFEASVFYSVAQHSVLVSRLVPPEHALKALFHDAEEAYLGDVSTPLKQLIPGYKELARKARIAVFTRLGFTLDMPPEIKNADLVALATEKRDLMTDDPRPWGVLKGITEDPARITPLSPCVAYVQFMNRFSELTAAD